MTPMVEILIVDDSAVESELMRRTITRAGFQAVLARDGEQALALARAHRPALILSDINMPRMNGYQLCHAIKFDADLWNVPVVLVTVLSEPQDIMEAINAGADGYAVKPFDERGLLERIHDLLATPILRKRSEERRSEQLEYDGRPYVINGGSQQILNLLLSVYKSTLVQNVQLTRVQNQLNLLNDELDRQVQERTQSLAQSEARYRLVAENSSDTIWLFDVAADRFTYVSPSVMQQRGFSVEEAMQQSLTDTLDAASCLTAKAMFNDVQAAFARGDRSARTQVREFNQVCKDGSTLPIEVVATLLCDEQGRISQIQGVSRDISERKKSEALQSLQTRRAEALLQLPRIAETLEESAFMQRGLELAEELTQSQVAFIHFVNDDQEHIELVTWSSNTLKKYCSAVAEQHYPISQAGLWADALRQRAPVVINDYAQAQNRCGLPDGHAALNRLISVPVFENGPVRMIAGVGNKSLPYNDTDVDTVLLVANEIWRIISQRRAEQALRNSEARLRSILRATPVGIGVAIGRVMTEANEFLLSLTGYARTELIGQPGRMLYPSDAEFERVGREGYDRLDQQDFVTLEAQWRRKDGTIIDVQLSVALTDPGDRTRGVTFSVQDISARIATENRVRQLALAVEQSPESIVITDLDARLEYVNESFLRNTGYTREECLGQNPRILHSGRTPPATYASLWSAITQGRPWSGEFINRRKDGSEYVEFAIITPLRQANGQITHYVAVKEDITEKKRIAAELDENRLYLEERVEQRTIELKAAQQKAEQLARVKSDFLANMSHEIRTPLNAVLGFAQVGQRDCAEAGAAERFGRIVESGQLLLRVVNDILDFSKIEAGKLEIERGRLRPKIVVDRCAELLREGAVKKGLRLQVAVAEDLPASCEGDELRMTQVLMNLLTNAVKFTAQGSVALRATREGGQLLFTVSDTGIGMSAQELSRIFLPFEQADSSTTRRFGGTGLGLAISKRLLDLMGGQVLVRSESGKGSQFEVRIPLQGEEAADASVPAPADNRAFAPASLSGVSILVAEDNEVNRLVLEELLGGEGCRLIQVENGQLAVDAVSLGGAQAFDLVLMDIQMPVMDGLEATRQIKAIAPDLPIIGLTAHALAEERERCLEAGMVEHVAKPIVLSDLLRAIHAHLHAEPTPVPAQAASDADAAALRAAPGAGPAQARLQSPQFLRRLTQTLLESNRDKPEAIRAAANRRDFSALGFLAHGIRGQSAAIVPEPLRALAGLIEDAANERDERAIQQAAELQAALARFLSDLAQRIDKQDEFAEGPASAALSHAELLALLDRMADLLDRGDSSVNEVHQQSAALFSQAFGQKAEPLGRAIRAFDYVAAHDMVIQLRSEWKASADAKSP